MLFSRDKVYVVKRDEHILSLYHICEIVGKALTIIGREDLETVMLSLLRLVTKYS